MNVLTGIQESRFIHTVSKNPRAAVVHAFLRKTAKGAIYVQKLNPSEVKPLVSDEENEESKEVEENSENSLQEQIKTNTKKNLDEEKFESISSNENSFERIDSSPDFKRSKPSTDVKNFRDTSRKLRKPKKSKFLKEKNFKKR